MIYVPSKAKRHKHKFPMTTGLNLVSLMDIFTILLLFLLIHVSGEGMEGQLPETVNLPLSTSTAKPEPATTVLVTNDDILLEGEKIAAVQDVLNDRNNSIAALEKELSYQSKDIEAGDESKRKIIIMGDKTIPFTLLKKVMYSCSKAGYSVITLAVIQREDI